MSYFSHEIIGQNLELNIAASDSIQTTTLNEISFIKKHALKKDVYKEITNIHNKLKKEGYFITTIDTIVKSEEKYTAYFTLGRKTDNIIVIIPHKLKIRNLGMRGDSIRIKTKEFENFKNLLLTDLDAKGNSFSEIKFTNPTYVKDTLVLQLKIIESLKRNIDKVLVKGYDEFPEKFIKRFFKINKQTIFSKQKMKEVSQLTKNLDFVLEKKKPEVLFKKDSTHVYLFLNKLETSSFDGIVNFASKEDGQGLLLNGNLDLKLTNILNTGENFELFWNKVAQEKSEFKINAVIPYIYHSFLSAEIGFNLYRQDSTFLNTSFNLKTEYDLSRRSKASLAYSNERSSYLLSTTENNLDSYSNYFIGTGYQLKNISNTGLYKNDFGLELYASLGKRKTTLVDVNQFKLKLLTLINLKTSQRSYLNIKTESQMLFSNNYLVNELYRIGGANSIRGLNEQSIYTNRFLYTNIEYRFLTSVVSYLYSITDIGFYNESISTKTRNALGLGGGYRFKLNNNFIDLGYVIGGYSDTEMNLNNSKLIVKWTTFF
ncbi:MAG: hypothetical protein P8Q53_03275 [Flavobacteriaceae bacterium]|nr:hypothetical protein [Flavobacteriaceae bacterium]